MVPNRRSKVWQLRKTAIHNSLQQRRALGKFKSETGWVPPCEFVGLLAKM